MAQAPAAIPHPDATATPRPWSPFYWVSEIMKAPSREARRKILDQDVPAYLRDLVEYTVTDCWNRPKPRKRP